MPELPEVQNTVNGLRETVIGCRIVSVWTDYGSSAYIGTTNIKDPVYFKYFASQVVEKTIIDITRRAKQIFITLDNDSTIVVHMKMTGHFLVGNWDWNAHDHKWQPPLGFWNKNWDISKEEVKKTMPFSDPFNDFIHLLFELDDGRQLAFSDMRKFATVFLVETPAELQAIVDSYGPEPLDPDTDFDTFMSRLKHRPNMMVKPALLDQSLVAGFGNIYSDEVLHLSRVHPESILANIPIESWQAIYENGQSILREAIVHGGDSMGDYRRTDGTGGTYQGMHQVYKREGQPCNHCNETIEKKQIGQRIGRYCPGCQIRY